MKLKKLTILAATLMLLVFNSCKKDTVDVTDLLKSVPSSAAGVVVINLEDIIEDTGSKIKNHSVVPSEELKSLIGKLKDNDAKDIQLFMNGETGIEPKGLVLFYDANRTYLTFSLYDVDKFIKYIENQNGTSFTDTPSGVKTDGSVAVKGAQAWITLSRSKIDADVISAYSDLETSRSFLVTQMGEKLLTEEDDIRGWAVLRTFVNEILSREQSGIFTLSLGFLFEDAESICFKVDFKKGEIESEAILLNDSFKPAKYQLPSDKIDVGTLKKLGSTCDVMMAFTLNSKLIKKFEQVGAAFGGALFGNLSEMFNNIDGTVGIIGSGSGIGESINGIITTKGEVSRSLKDIISNNMGTVSEDGKYLNFSKGDVKGKLDVAECAEKLKGCCLGIVVDATGVNSVGYGNAAPSDFKDLVVKFKPESGGLEIELDVNLSNPKENALLAILRNL